jgi:hypothetical protein
MRQREGGEIKKMIISMGEWVVTVILYFQIYPFGKIGTRTHLPSSCCTPYKINIYNFCIKKKQMGER